MKKFLLILTLGAFVACNDSATSSKEDKKDSVVNKIDSSADAKKAMVDSAAKMAEDTTKAKK